MRDNEALRLYTVIEFPRSDINREGKLCIRSRLEGVFGGRPAQFEFESTQPAIIEAMRTLVIGSSIKLFGKISTKPRAEMWAGRRVDVYRLSGYAFSMPRQPAKKAVA